jgi:hypothetical protein
MRVLDEYPYNEAVEGFEPLVVRAHLAEPVVNFHPETTFDGPLSFGAYAQYIAQYGDDLPARNSDWALDFDLPLARIATVPVEGADRRLCTPDGRVWVWASSRVSFAEPSIHTRVEVRRKPATEQMSTWSKAKRHHVGLGPLKARNAVHPAVVTPWVEWRVLGDPDEIRKLLGFVTHLGRLHSHGYGRVLRWEVEEDSSGQAWKSRALPAQGGFNLAVRAPLHHRSRLVPCL